METNIRRCQYCGLAYDWRRSGSRWLRMTYCGVLCEMRHQGFTIEGLLTAPHIRPNPPWLEEIEQYLVAEAAK